MDERIKIVLPFAVLYTFVHVYTAGVVGASLSGVSGFGFYPIEFSFPTIFVYFLAFLGFFLLPLGGQPSAIFLWFFYLFHGFGAIVASTFLSRLSTFGEVGFSILVFAIFFAIVFFVRLDLKRLHIVSKFASVLPGFPLLLAFGLCLIFFLYFGFSFEYFTYSEIYEERAEAKAYLRGDVDLWARYFLPMIGYSVVPYFLGKAFTIYGKFYRWRSFGVLAFAAFVQSQVFLLLTTKSAVGAILFAGSVAALVACRQNAPRTVFVVIIGVFVFAISCHLVLGYSDPLIHWVRRVFVTPGMNVFYYWREFGFLNKAPMDSPPLHISRAYYAADGNAVSGFIGSGMASGWFYGFIIQGVALVVFLRFFDGLIYKISLPLMAGPLVVCAYLVSNTAFSVYMVTYGGLLIMLLMLLELKRGRGESSRGSMYPQSQTSINR